MDKIKLNIPVVVEGKYDKIALSQVIDATIITTDGFGVFKNAEKKALIRRLSENGVVVLCDSDGAGGVIRSFLNGIIDKSKIYGIYSPQIKGKEPRKTAPSKEGYLGVEGMSADVLRSAFLRFIERRPEFCADNQQNSRDGNGVTGDENKISKMDFWSDGLSGSPDSSEMRDKLAEYFSLPKKMTANSLLSALNMICAADEYRAAVAEIKKNLS